MGKVFQQLDDALAAWISRQPVFFVATAPEGPGGHVNVSPKGGAGTLRVIDPLTVAYVDFQGSGIETVAHVRENGRIVVMFCAWEGPPKILRLHGRGEVLEPGDPGHPELLAGFDLEEMHPAAPTTARTVVRVDVTRISDSCGYAVPLMDYRGERDQLFRWADNRLRKVGPDGLAAYRRERNAESIDGLPGLSPDWEPSEGAIRPSRDRT